MSFARSALLLPIGLLVACAPPDACERAAAVDPELDVEIGNPDGFAAATEDGAAVVPSSGEQGGHHLFFSVRTAGIWPGDPKLLGDDDRVPTIRVTLTDLATGEAIAEEQWDWQALDGDELDATLAAGSIYLPEPEWTLESDATGAYVAGPQAVTLVATVEDTCGNVAERTLDLTLDW